MIMPGLGETTAMLARLKRGAPMTSSEPKGAGVLTETRSFGANPGALKMWSYAPPNLARGAPLVVVLHGCTQTAKGYAVHAGWIALAQRLGFAVLAPEQSTANNPNRCFNWFAPDDIARGRGEAASIAAMIATAVDTLGADAERVFISGLSAGGAMTAVMLATYPELFAGGAIIAGLPFGVARSVPDALRAMSRGDGRDAQALASLVRDAAPSATRPLRLVIWHGDADRTVNPANGRDLSLQWVAALNLESAPCDTAATRGRTTSVWRGEGPDSAVLEMHMVEGLGHGTPLSTRMEGDVGSVAPFMLEAGLCSTLETAAFWGLAEPADRDATRVSSKAMTTSTPPQAASDASPKSKSVGVGGQVMDAIAGHVPPQVQDVIAKALRAAGLLS